MNNPIIMIVIIPMHLEFEILRFFCFVIFKYKNTGRNIAIIDNIIPEIFKTLIKALGINIATNIAGVIVIIAEHILENFLFSFWSITSLHSSKTATQTPMIEVKSASIDIIQKTVLI